MTTTPRRVRARGAAGSGTPAERRLIAALFAAGLATFGELYAVQAVLPGMAAELRVTASAASWAVSAATGALAVSVLPWAAVADRIGRSRAMKISAAVTALCGLVLPFAPTFAMLLVVRTVSGAALGAVPALAVAHLVSGVDARRVVSAGGMYVAGTTIGGLSGRLLAGWVGAAAGWRWGLGAAALLVLASAVAFIVLLPPAPATRSRPPKDPAARGKFRIALCSRPAWICYAQAFLLMGAFVSVYNLLSFRLLAAPYYLHPAATSSLFCVYLVGTLGSAMVGRITSRWRRSAVLPAAGALMAAGVALMLARPLVLIVLGLVVMTFGFFVAHAIASAWAAQLVPDARSQASAFYGLSYYAGSCLVGAFAGAVYTGLGWTGAMVLVLLAVLPAVVVATRLGARKA